MSVKLALPLLKIEPLTIGLIVTFFLQNCYKKNKMSRGPLTKKRRELLTSREHARRVFTREVSIQPFLKIELLRTGQRIYFKFVKDREKNFARIFDKERSMCNADVTHEALHFQKLHFSDFKPFNEGNHICCKFITEIKICARIFNKKKHM